MTKLSIVTLFVLIMAPAVWAGETNILKNPDFSETLNDDATRPAEWRIPGDAWRRTNEDGPTGNFCLEYESKVPRALGPVTQMCSSVPYSEYELRFASKSDGALRPLVRIIDAKSKKCLARLIASGGTEWKVERTRFHNGSGKEFIVEICADAAQERGNAAPAGNARIGDLWLAPPKEQVPVSVRRNAGRNIALGKKYEMPKPNYSYCTDPGDYTQLTDGIYTKGYFWTQKTTVGWSGISAKFISIDLDRVQPIKGISFSTAAGVAGVDWPAELFVFVSDEGAKWFQVGDLVKLSARHSEPPKGKYANHVFWTDKLNTHGRFVQIAATPTAHYLFVDEIEIFQGDDALLNKAYKVPPIENVQTFWDARQFNGLIKAQLRRDLDAAAKDLAEPGLSTKDKAALSDKARKLEQQIDKMPNIRPDGFHAVLPMTELERDIFGFQAEVWRAQGKRRLRLWKSHRWDPLAPSQEPPERAPAPVIDVRMMNNEYRADVFNLTNAYDTEKRIRLRLEGLPGGADPGYVTVHEVLSVGTRHFVAVAAALPPAKREGQDYVVVVPAGMTRQVWLSFNPDGLAQWSYKGQVVLVDDSGEKLSVPIRLQVFPLRFPDTTTLYLGGWSYTNVPKVYGVTPENRDLLIAHLKEHHVNAPWATSSAMPAGRFDADGDLVGAPDTRNFDEWAERWEGAQRYMVFSAVRDSFAGSKIGTEPFEKKVANWIHFWAQHVRDLGLSAGQLGLLLVDEPNRKEQYDVITAWAKVIQKAEPEVIVWEDPQVREDKTCLEMMSCADVLVPYRRQWLERGAWHRELYRNQRGQGRELGFYSADGPARCFDPFSYYLLQHWHCFKVGGRWSGFWAFGDTGRASVWNEYAAKGNGPYCPIYLDDASLTPAKYMEAIREGAQDYEYLVMLRDRIAGLEKTGRSGAMLARAKALLNGACDRVLKGEKGANYRWDEEKERAVADVVRIEILEMLTDLRDK